MSELDDVLDSTTYCRQAKFYTKMDSFLSQINLVQWENSEILKHNLWKWNSLTLAI